MLNIYIEALNSFVSGNITRTGLGNVCRDTYYTDISSVESKEQGKLLTRGAIQVIEYSTQELNIPMSYPDGTSVTYDTKLEMATDLAANLGTYYPDITV